MELTPKDYLNIFSDISSLAMAIIAIWLSLKFYFQTKNTESNTYHDLEVLRTYLNIAFTTTDFISKDLHHLTRTIVNISPHDFEKFLRNN